MKNLWTLIKKDLLIDYNFLFNIKEVTKDKKTRKKEKTV